MTTALPIDPEKDMVPGLTNRLVQFARLLRDNGFENSASDVADLLQVLSADLVMNDHKFRQCLQLIFCRRFTDQIRFHEIYDAYWHHRVGGKRSVMQQTGLSQSKSFVHDNEVTLAKTSGLALYYEFRNRTEGDSDIEASVSNDNSEAKMTGASTIEALSKIDFDKTKDPEEHDKLITLAERLGRRLRYRLSRRRQARSKGIAPDFRKIFRHSLATSGIPMKLWRKVRKEPPISLLLFVDVSGSMDSYSLFFIRFIHAMSGGFKNAEAFLFHTKLAHISQALKEANPVKMMDKMSLISQGWSGGTKIGEALQMFNDNYAKKYAGPRSIALIMSDGYDTGSSEQLVQQLKKLKQKCYKIIWLNPMLGREEYEPSTDSMQKALPYLDVFAPAHNLRSLMELEETLVKA